MNDWMMCKVKYTKQLDDGALKRVSELYLFAAISFTDAETRIYEELGSVIKGEFNVVSIARQEIHDIFSFDDSDVWYKSKIQYENTDADTDKAKKVTQNFLVSAGSVRQATERIKESLQGMFIDYKIKSVIETNIIDIFPFADKLEVE
tara:strand:+ start:2963 stop:3406 length:444 start_codon:yes stop_codon:yes gene_type:complete